MALEIVGPEVEAYLKECDKQVKGLPPPPRRFYFKDDPDRPERSTRGCFLDALFAPEHIERRLADRFFEGDVPYMHDNLQQLPEKCWDDFMTHYCVDAGPRADRPFKVIFYGMSGYTGSLIMEFLKRECKDAVVGEVAFAGRTVSKVEAVRDRILAGTKWADTPCLKCNLDNPFDIERLVSSTRVVANIAGPFMLTGGERLVEACIHYDTDYTDVSGEVPYSAKLLEYHDLAWDAGVYIVPSAAFAGGMPDVGSYVVAKKIRDLYGEETRNIHGYVESKGQSSLAPSGGTLQTRAAMSGAADKWVRDVMTDPFALGGRIDNGARDEDQDRKLTQVFKCPIAQRWVAPHVYAFFETRVIRRSNWLHNQVVGGPEAGDWYGCGLNISVYALATSEAQAKEIKKGSTSVKAEEEKLKAAGKFYGAGDGPPFEDLIEARIKMVYHFVGISESGKRVGVSFMGRDGYYETARVVAEMAFAMALDSPELRTGPGHVRGGVLTPGIAGRHVLPRRLRKSGMGFKDWTGGKMPSIDASHAFWDMPPDFEPDLDNE